MASLDYRAAGVDIDAGEALVERIKPLAAATRIPEALTGVGGFAALCGLPAGMRDPIMVSGTDGVGTKLRVAQLADRHDTVGIDLVAMCVNDIITTGARPLFFLDYVATTQLNVDRMGQVIAGIATGCSQAGCALLGGETAEHPGGAHDEGGYDLAGFAVGVVERDALLPRNDVKPDDVLLGVRSNGLHSNGYSLASKAVLERAGIPLSANMKELQEPLVDALLRPTRIYARAVAAAIAAGGVKAISHITGGGLPGNVPRVLPDGLGAELDTTSWTRQPIFDLVQRCGEVETAEMFRAFNMGLGLVIAVDEQDADAVCKAVGDAGEDVSPVGRVVATPGVSGEARIRLIGH